MAKVVNYYKRIGDFGREQYFNPNAGKGALIHPFRAILVGPSGSYKSNTVLCIINACACFQKIILVAASGKTEPLYKFLKHKLGKQLVVLDDIDQLPELKSDVKVQKKKKEKEHKKKKKHSKDETSDESSSESEASEEEIDDKSADDDEEPEEKNLQNTMGKTQRLVVFDDMVFQGPKVEKIISNWFSRSRHENFSVILTTQNWYKVPRSCRLNASAVVILKLTSSKDIKQIIGDLSLDLSKEQLVKAYKYATEEPGHFLLIDLATSNPEYKFRKDFDEAITF